MYIPRSFKEERPEILHALMREQPLALLVSHGPDGLDATPVPFVLYPDEGPRGVLRAHLARELEWLTESIYVIPGDKLYRVQLGPYASRNDAEKVAERIRQSHGQKPSFVVR